MPPLNSKKLYRLNRLRKDRENTPPIDSLDNSPSPSYPVCVRRQPHLRSQSCPFDAVTVPVVSGQTEESGTVRLLSTEARGKHKKNQSYGSQQMMGSMSQVSLNCNTVIVRDTPLDALSSVLYRRSNPRQLLKKQTITLKNDPYQKTRLQQQIRGYELRQEL